MTVTVAELQTEIPAGSLVSVDITNPATIAFKAVDDFLSAFQIAQEKDNLTTPSGANVNAISTSDGASLEIPDPANPGQTVTVVPRFYSVTTYRRIIVDDVLAPLV